LVKAIEWFGSQENPVDVLIIGRGGGSLEDLWPFNEEPVARAIFNCPIPTISAVGHEVDFSITDFVADARAATPTQAVVIAAPDINELRYMIDDYTGEMESVLQQKIQTYRDYVYRLANSHALLVVQEKLKYQKNRVDSLIEQLNSRVDRTISERRSNLQQLRSIVETKNPRLVLQKWTESVTILSERLDNRYIRQLSGKKEKLNNLISALAEVNPKAPLQRGFTRILQDGKWIRSSKDFDKSLSTEIEWNDGTAKIST
jgi:exodeoxyribonuclease VII large subunit